MRTIQISMKPRGGGRRNQGGGGGGVGGGGGGRGCQGGKGPKKPFLGSGGVPPQGNVDRRIPAQALGYSHQEEDQGFPL